MTGTIVCLVSALAFVLPAYAVDVNQLQYMPSITLTSQLPSGIGLGGSSAPPFPLSPTFGVTPGPATFGVCPDNLLLTGVRVHFDETALFNTGGVTGLRMFCRFFSEIGGTDTITTPTTQDIGSHSTQARVVECPSGQAVTGIRGRSGTSLDAITIDCAVVSPNYSSALASFTGDAIFGSGLGVIVSAVQTVTRGSAVGDATGGFPFTFDCPAAQPFIRGIAATTGLHLGMIQAMCSQVLTQPAHADAALPDFTVSTRGQERVVTHGSTRDSFTVEVFNLGAAVPPHTIIALRYYVDIIFSSADVQIAAFPTNCFVRASGLLRCDIPNFSAVRGSGGHVTLGTITYVATHARPDAPIIVVQASFDVPDEDFGNNTYGFSVTVN